MHDIGIGVVGIQEGRSTSTRVMSGNHFDMYIAAADANGSRGTQLWVNHSLRLRLQAWDAPCSRLVTVIGSIGSTGIDVVLVAAHAPHNADTDVNKNKFWDALTVAMSSCRRKYPNAFVFLAIDANARVGSAKSPAIGREERCKENENGSLFRATLEHLDMVAVNTFFRCGWTWRSPHGTTARLDYVCILRRHWSCVEDCVVADDLDLSLRSYIDHRGVIGTLRIGVSDCSEAASTKSATRPFSFDHTKLEDRHARDKFQRLVWSFSKPPNLSVGAHLELLNNHIRRSATLAYGGPCRQARQPWVSADTWAVLKWNAPMRRWTDHLVRAKRQAFANLCFYAWAAELPQPYPAPSDGGVRGWQALAPMETSRRCFLRCCRLISKVTLGLRYVQASIHWLCTVDRNTYLANISEEISTTAVQGRFAATYKFVRRLAGKAAIASVSIANADGSKTTSIHEQHLRWQEHYSGVFNAEVVGVDWLKRTRQALPCQPAVVSRSVEETRRALSVLKHNKGVGPDGIPAELLQSGESAIAVKLNEVECSILDEMRWPYQWQGGKLLSSYKGKGPKDECDSHRGLLLADHSGKAFASRIDQVINPVYESNMPESQFGAVSKRGTDYAAHIVQSLIAIAEKRGWSIFVLYVDLVKAFDRVVRELLFGYPSEVPDDASAKKVYLEALGLPTEVADKIFTYIEEKRPLLEQWGIDDHTIGLIRGLHDGSWFQVGNLPTAILSKVGGRQGCKFGSLVFNSVYTIALDALHDSLERDGLTLQVPCPGAAFWGTDVGEAPEMVNVADCTFVDDECVVVMQPTAAALDTAIDKVLSHITNIFSALRLEINWSPGKTEAMIRFRGSGSQVVLERRRVDGKVSIPIPGNPSACLTIVDQYKHLGCITSLNATSIADARLKERNALNAYVPLATSIFASKHVFYWVKLLLMDSLVLTRLLFNTHVVVPSRQYTKRLSNIYMRVLRCIFGEPRFQRTEHTDFAIRQLMQRPSVDCLLQRGRLKYLKRLLAVRPRPLLAVLHCRVKNAMLPWVQLVLADLRVFQERVLAKSGFWLPDPATAPDAWATFIINCGSLWGPLVDQIFFCESIADVAAAQGDAPALRPFTCNMCTDIGALPTPAFTTRKALHTHLRRCHNIRVNARKYIGADFACPVCNTIFSTRLRAIAHLSDGRRTECSSQLAGLPELAPSEVVRLDAIDSELRREAFRDGHSRPLATSQARRCDGSAVGRVRL